MTTPIDKIASAALAAVILLVAAACGDGQDDATETSVLVTSTVPATAASSPPTEPPAPTTTVALPSTGNAEIDALVAASRTAEYHAIYDDGKGGVLEIYRADGQVVLFQSGQAVYQLSDGTAAFCNLGEQSVCTSLPAEAGSLDATLAQLFGAFGAVLAGAGSETSPFSDTTEIVADIVAERPARCATATTQTGGFAVCLDAEIGIVLSASGDDGTGTRSVEARRVEVGNVDPAIFELPAQLSA